MTGVTIPMEPEVMGKGKLNSRLRRGSIQDLHCLFCNAQRPNQVCCISSGEWEISAFDGSLKSRGMSIQYTVRSCDHGDNGLVDHERDIDDISDYIDQLDQGPRGMRPQNNTVLVRVCTPLTPNDTQSLNASDANGAGNRTRVTQVARQSRCQLKRLTLKPQEKQNTDGVIPQDVLEGLEIDKQLASYNATTRQRRQLDGTETSVAFGSEASGDGVTLTEIWEQVMENSTGSNATVTTDGSNQTLSVSNASAEESDQNNEIVLNRDPHLDVNPSPAPPANSNNHSYVQLAPERLRLFEKETEKNGTANSNYTAGIRMSLEYDDYNEEVIFLCCVHVCVQVLCIERTTWEISSCKKAHCKQINAFVLLCYVLNLVLHINRSMQNAITHGLLHVVWFSRGTAHWTPLAPITLTYVLERSDIGTTTLLLRRSPGTTA